MSIDTLIMQKSALDITSGYHGTKTILDFLRIDATNELHLQVISDPETEKCLGRDGAGALLYTFT